MDTKILVIGAGGQIGKELVQELCNIYGSNKIVASDIRPDNDIDCAYEALDVLDTKRLVEIIKKHNIKEIYHLAALLSATADQYLKFFPFSSYLEPRARESHSAIHCGDRHALADA